MRNLVYTTNIASEEDLVTRIVVAEGAIDDTTEVFANVRQNMIRLCNLWLHVHAGMFEPLMKFK